MTTLIFAGGLAAISIARLLGASSDDARLIGLPALALTFLVLKTLEQDQ